MRRLALCLGAWLLTACGGQGVTRDPGPDLAADKVVSGYTFLTAETQALQDDDFANPGMLWVEQGEALFNAGDKSCASCHAADALRGAAATYPKIDAATGKLQNLEGRINQCRTRHQDEALLPYESEPLLSLTAYVAHLSNGMPINVETGGAATPYYAKGRDYFFTRRGQFNLACTTCHDRNWGKRLRGDTISQGHGNGFPAYRLEWEGLGSLHRRLRDCDTGVRAEPLAYGDETYVALELYLAARAQGLTLESPAVRR